MFEGPHPTWCWISSTRVASTGCPAGRAIRQPLLPCAPQKHVALCGSIWCKPVDIADAAALRKKHEREQAAEHALPSAGSQSQLNVPASKKECRTCSRNGSTQCADWHPLHLPITATPAHHPKPLLSSSRQRTIRTFSCFRATSSACRSRSASAEYIESSACTTSASSSAWPATLARSAGAAPP